MHSLRTAAFTAAALFFSGSFTVAHAQTNAEPTTRRVRATRVPNGTITIDSRLDESVWAQGEAAGDFVQMQPVEGAPATAAHRSEVRFLYDDENLYVGATLFEDEPDKLVTNDLKRDFPGARCVTRSRTTMGGGSTSSG